MTGDEMLRHTFRDVFLRFLRQEGFGSTDANVNYAAMILHTLHTSTQGLSFHRITLQ